MKPPQPLTGGSVVHLRTQSATMTLQESLYPLLPTMRSVYWQVPRQQPSRTPATLWRRRTAPAELWVSSNDSVAPKDEQRNASHDECRANMNALETFKRWFLQFNHSSFPFRSWQLFTQMHFEKGGKAAPRRSSPVKHGDGTRRAIDERPNLYKKALCYTVFIWKKKKEKPSSLCWIERQCRKPCICVRLTTLLPRCHWRHASLRILVNYVQEVFCGGEMDPNNAPVFDSCSCCIRLEHAIHYVDMNYILHFILWYLEVLCSLKATDVFLAYCTRWNSFASCRREGNPRLYCEWRWCIICMREIRVNWELGHWQSWLLIAVI